jgi:predicted nucleic acid-binding protein
MLMIDEYYFDTSIWLDFYEKRGKNGEVALELINKIIRGEKVIFYSDIVVRELKRLGFS